MGRRDKKRQEQLQDNTPHTTVEATAADDTLLLQPTAPQTTAQDLRFVGQATTYGAVEEDSELPSRGSVSEPRDRVLTMEHHTGRTTIVPIQLDSTRSGEINRMPMSPRRREGTVLQRAMFQLQHLIGTNWRLNILLLAVPLAVFGDGLLSPAVLFLFSFLGLIPLAGILGDLTEDLALHSNDVLGALVNVTFGNATELIISVTALRAGMLDVIKLSLIGSVMGNMLLVLGSSFLVGGLRVKVMTFSNDAVNTYAPLLLLSVLGFVIPSAYWSASQYVGKAERHDTILTVSRYEALVMSGVYAAYLYFQLVTHKAIFDEVEAASVDSDDFDEEDGTPIYTATFGTVGLAVVSVLISKLSDVLISTLSDAAISWHVPKQFIGIILVPIVGNAAEHSTAIVMAARNKLDIAVGVALGSSIQIAMFVMPLLVLIGWVIGQPLTLNFHPFLTVIITVCVLVVNHVVTDGKTNWLEGVFLMSAYLMLCLVFWTGTIDMS